MQRFNIYKKSKKFHWSSASIFFSLLILLYLFFFIKNNFFSLAKGLSEDAFLKSVLLFSFIILVLKSIGFIKPKALNGTFSGFLEFFKDAVIIDNEKFQIEEIKLVEISNNDYCGKPTRNGFDSSLSSGIKNRITLTLNSGEKKTCNFELYNQYDLGKVEDELVSYYLKGKIEFTELCKVLKLKQSEIEEYKNQITLL